MSAEVWDQRPSTSRFRHYLDAARGNWAVVLAVLVLVLFVVVPLALLLMTSLREGTPGRLKEWTLDNYHDAFTTSLVFEAFTNTVAVAFVATVISLLLAGFFAWLVERSDMPYRNLAFTILLLPIAVPSILFVLAWTVLLQPRVGIFNVPLRELLQTFGVQLTEGPFNIYSLGGVIFLDSLRGVTTIFLMLVAAFRLFDSTLEEASKVSGAGTFETLRRITIPLLAPAILAAAMYSFISSLDQFEAALAAGLPGQVFLLPTLIFFTVQLRSPADYGLSAVYSIFFMVLMILLLVVYRRIVSKSERFVTVTGKAYRPEPVPLGRWRYPAFAAVALFGIFTVILPAAVLFWLSLMPPNTAPVLGSEARLSFDIYANIFSNPRVITIASNTLIMLVATATITMAIAFLVSWAIVRGKGRARGLLDGLSFLPYAFPGVTVAISLIFVFLNPPGNYFRIYGTLSILVLGLTVIYIAFATRLMNGAIAQIGKELEEAGRTSGATQLAVMWRITLPLLLPAFIAGWIWVASHAMRSFSIPLVLSSQRNAVIAPEIWRVWQRGYLSEAAAYGIILMIILIPITIWMRRLMGSLEVGGKSAGKKRWRKTLSRWTGRGEMERPAPAGVGQIRTES
jgi:iron(III) transport system permease protein